ncbi:MAG: PulJ/GspJ family protein [Armatimonadota bacterium]
MSRNITLALPKLDTAMGHPMLNVTQSARESSQYHAARIRGVTLLEMLISVFIIGLTFFVIINISIKASKLYARTNVHIEPQASAMLAFKRLEREIRQAMVISTTTPTPSTWIEITIPEKDDDGLNKLTVDAQGKLVLIPGETISYFLGDKLTLQDATRKLWKAQPNTAGSTLFRSESSYDKPGNYFNHCKIVIDGIVNPNDPDVMSEPQLTRDALENTLFVYTPYDDNGTPDDYTDDHPLSTTNVINITLVVKTMQSGRPVYHPLWTKFCLRNN